MWVLTVCRLHILWGTGLHAPNKCKAFLAAAKGKLHAWHAKGLWSTPGGNHIPEGLPSDHSRAACDEAGGLIHEAERIRFSSRSL